MSARRSILLLASLLTSALVASACSESSTSPTEREAVAADIAEGLQSLGTATGSAARSARVAVCLPRGPEVARATIGPNGGVLRVGSSFLFVPRGALAQNTVIEGSVAAGDLSAIHFQPSGLVFSRPARLLLDAGGCTLPASTPPAILYLAPEGSVAERISATYYKLWGWVAAPISHFSQYAIGV